MNEAAHDLAVTLRTLDGVPVASVRGEIDLESRDRFEQELAPLRAGSGPAVLDLENVPFMDSSGLHVVVQLWHAMRSGGRELAVACTADGVRKVFELTALDAVLRLYDDAAAAARAVAPGNRGVSGRAR